MMWKVITFGALLAVGALANTITPSADFTGVIKQKLTQYCTDNGAADKVNDAEKAIKDFSECAKKFVNIETLNSEIEEAKPHGALDEVFKKYCAKSQELKTCIRTLISGLGPCTGENVRSQIPNINNGTDHIIDFICYKDGDRIALFIAEEGPDCIQKNVDEIKTKCIQVPDLVKATDKPWTLKERCDKFDTISKCVVTQLETCSTPTPGNMAESLLRYIKNGTPCKDLK